MASTSEYEQQQFWEDQKNLSKLLLEDLLIWGECAYKISNQGIERLKPNTFIINDTN